MLPIIDKPLIEYAVEEAVLAGITEIIFITSHTKRAIEDHFDQNFELDEKLIQSGKHDILKRLIERYLQMLSLLTSDKNLKMVLAMQYFMHVT